MKTKGFRNWRAIVTGSKPMESNPKRGKGPPWTVAPAERGARGGDGVLVAYQRANREHVKFMRNLFITFASMEECDEGCYRDALISRQNSGRVSNSHSLFLFT
jgi:hypothetical protein